MGAFHAPRRRVRRRPGRALLAIAVAVGIGLTLAPQPATAAPAAGAPAALGTALTASTGTAATSPLPLPTYDATAVANPPGTASAGSVPMGGTAGDFSVSDVGSARYVVPLQVVPGRGGLQPRLALTYSSDAGDGQIGTGFSLSGLSQISRCDKTVADDGVADGVALTADDRFCLDGRKLVAVSGTYGGNGTEYRTIPDAHVRIRSFVAAGAAGQGPTSFTVWTADGLLQEFGAEGATSVDDPHSFLNFFRVGWSLTKTADRAGNVITYAYDTRQGAGLVKPELERWPTEIRYGRPDLLDRRVTFGFTGRPDIRSGFLYGQPRESTKLLSTVTMSAEVGGSWQQARQYKLAYQTTPVSHVSRLAQLTECGRVAAECKRPTLFGWSSGTAGFADGITQTSANSLPLVPTSTDSIVTAADFNGDGRTDLAWPEEDNWRFVYAESGGYRRPVDRMFNPWKTKATSFTIDYDLDGRVDLMPRSPSISPYRPILTRGEAPFVQAETEFYGGFNQVIAGNQFAGGMTGDFDGDGYQDVLEYRKPLGASGEDFPVKWDWRRRTGTVSPSIDGPAHTDDAAFGPQSELGTLQGLTPDKVLVIDANGDGRDEIIYPTANSAVSLDPMGRTQSFTYFSLRNALLKLDIRQLDVNGDGLVDLITNGDEVGLKTYKLYVRLNTGQDFSTPQDMGVTAVAEALSSALVVDDDGDGRDELLVGRANATDKWIGMDMIRMSSAPGAPMTFTKSATAITFTPRLPGQLATQGPRLVDADGDGRSDIAVVNQGVSPALRVFPHASGAQGTARMDLLTSITEGTQVPSGSSASLPATVAVDYLPLTNGVVYQPGSCPRTDHQTCLVGGSRTVVRQVRRDAGLSDVTTDPVQRQLYSYRNGRIDKKSRAFLGFAERLVTTSAVGGSHGPVTTRTFYSNTSRLDPRPVERWTFAALPGGAQSLHRTTLGWLERSTTIGGYFGYVASEQTRDYELTPACPSCLTSQSVAQFDAQGRVPFRRSVDRNVDVDQYGNVALRTVEYYGPDQNQADSKTTVTSTFDIDAGNWLVGRAKRVVTTDAARPDGPWIFGTRTVDQDFLPGTNQVTRSTSYGSATQPGQRLVTEIGYDSAGNVVRRGMTDAGTGEVRESTFGYDPMGYPHAAMNALGHVIRTGYDPVSGALEVAVDANGLRTDATYDSLGRPIKVRQPSGAETVTGYALVAVGTELLQRSETRSGTGAVMQLVTDRLGRTVTERFKGFDGALRVRDTGYEPEGNLASVSVFRRTTTSGAVLSTYYSYDDTGRLLSTTDPAHSVRTIGYTGLTTTATDALGRKSVELRDGDGRTVRVTDAVGTPQAATRTYRFGPFDTLLSSEVDGVPTSRSTMAYDEQGRVIQTTDAERGTTSSSYNAFGEVVSRKDADQRVTALTHDALGRLTGSTVTQGGATRSVLTNVYDTADHRSRKGMLMASSLVDSTAATGAAARTGTEYFYDTLSRMSEVRYRVPQEINPDVLESLDFSYGYDAFGRTTSLQYPQLAGQPAPARVLYGYGSPDTTNGALQRVTRGDQPAPADAIWTAQATDEQDQLIAEQSGDLVGATLTRDALGRISTQSLRTSTDDADPSRLLFSEVYSYDAAGNLRGRYKTREGGAILAEAFSYDALDRISDITLQYPQECPAGGCTEFAPGTATTVTDPPPPLPPIPGDWVTVNSDSYTYDALGNIATSKRRGVFGYDPARPTQVTSVTAGSTPGTRKYGYDAVGNQTSRPEGSVSYNDFNLPVTIAAARGDVTAAFLYYPGGDRARKRTGAGTTTFVPGLYERQHTGTSTEHRFLVPVGGRTVATMRFTAADGAAAPTPRTTTFLHADRLGSTTLVTGNTGTGPEAIKAAILEDRSYDAFGRVRNPDWKSESAPQAAGAVDVGFTGHDDDRELGLVDMGARVYDPQLGRFLTPDPQVTGAHPAQAWNRYAYVSNNPLTSTDPDGHEECADCTFWDEGGGGGWGGSGGGGVWGPSGPDASHEGTAQFFDDSAAYDEGGERAINPVGRDSPDIQHGADRHDRDVAERDEELDKIDEAREIEEANARYRDAYLRAYAKYKQEYQEAASQASGSGSEPSAEHQGSAAMGPNALACAGDCPITGAAETAETPYIGGPCRDGGTSCFVDGAPTPESSTAGPEAAQPAAPAPAPAPVPAPAAPAFSVPTSIKPGDSLTGTLGVGVGMPMVGGVGVGTTRTIIYNPSAWGGFNLGAGVTAGVYGPASGASISAGWNGYQGWNFGVSVRLGSPLFGVGPDITWSTKHGATTGSGISGGWGPVSAGVGY